MSEVEHLGLLLDLCGKLANLRLTKPHSNGQSEWKSSCFRWRHTDYTLFSSLFIVTTQACINCRLLLSRRGSKRKEFRVSKLTSTFTILPFLNSCMLGPGNPLHAQTINPLCPLLGSYYWANYSRTTKNIAMGSQCFFARCSYKMLK